MAVRFARGEREVPMQRCHYSQRQQRQPFISQAFYSRSDKLNTNFQHGFSAAETLLCSSVVSGRTQGSSPVNHLIRDRERTDGREETRLFLRLLVIMQPVRNQFELLKFPQ